MDALLSILFHGLAYAMILYIVSVGLSITMGLMGFVNLAHGVFAMAGGYVTVTLMNTYAVPFGVALLTAFIVVSVGVIILRVRQPDLPRAFKVPGYPVTPALSVLACGYILVSLHWYTWIAFTAWVALALVFYFVWGRHHSALNEREGQSEDAR